MNAYYYLKRKTFSFLVSAALHALLLFLLLTFSYTLYKSYKSENTQESFPQRTTPAKVSFGSQQAQKISAPTVVVPPKLDITQEEQNIPVAPPEVKKQDSVPQEQEVAKPAEVTEAIEQEPDSYSGTNTSLAPAYIPESNRLNAQATQEVSTSSRTSQIINGLRHIKEQARKRSVKKRGLTAAALVQGYRNSYRSEYEGATSGQESQSASNNAGKYPSHVQERLDDWHIAGYREKIYKSLVDTAKWFKKYVFFKESFSKTIKIILSVDEDTLTLKIPQDQLSGIEEMDMCVTEFLKSVQLPPVPKRLQGKMFAVPISITMNCSRGNGCVNFVPV